MTIEDNANVTPGSAVGDVHQTSPLYATVVITPSKFPIKIKVKSVIANGKNVLPVRQSIVSLIIPLTKSNIHSITFCTPVGFICNFLAPNTDKISTIKNVTVSINTLDKLTDNQGMPNTFSMIGAPCSIISPHFQYYFLLNNKKSSIITT